MIGCPSESQEKRVNQRLFFGGLHLISLKAQSMTVGAWKGSAGCAAGGCDLFMCQILCTHCSRFRVQIIEWHCISLYYVYKTCQALTSHRAIQSIDGM